MSHAITFLPVVPVRRSPSHRSEMVSQLLFGESVTVLGEEENFLNVITTFDHYEGWIQKAQLRFTGEKDYQPMGRFSANFITAINFNGEVIRVPHGCEMVRNTLGHGISKSRDQPAWEEESFLMPVQSFTHERLEEIYSVYLNVPYLWGGRSVFGIDCSGFCQQVFRIFGLKLQRDAYQQAKQGKPVEFLSLARPGDLAFFNNDEGRIIHVGILLDPGRIVHASAWVRIDEVNPEGIFHDGLKTHQLHSIRRLVE